MTRVLAASKRGLLEKTKGGGHHPPPKGARKMNRTTYVIEGKRDGSSETKEYKHYCHLRPKLKCDLWECSGCRILETHKLHEDITRGNYNEENNSSYQI